MRVRVSPSAPTHQWRRGYRGSLQNYYSLVQIQLGAPLHILMEMNIMKFYSEITEKLYDTPEELQAEEEKFHAEAMVAEQREIERINAKAEVDEAINNAKQLMDAYIDKYGSYEYRQNINNLGLTDLCKILIGY